MTTASVPQPLNVVCPNCNAQPGEPCTQPTERSRNPVKFFHYARITSVENAEHAQRVRTAIQSHKEITGPKTIAIDGYDEVNDAELEQLLSATSLEANEKIREQQDAATLEIPAELQPDRWRDLHHGLIAHEPCGAVFIPGPATKPLHEAECQSTLRGMSAEQIEEARKRPPMTTRSESEEQQINWAIQRHRRGHSSRPGASQSMDRATDLLRALGLKPFSVYSEGYAATGERGGATSHGTHWGHDFNDAIKRWKSEGGQDAIYLSESHDRWGRTTWSYWGCRLFETLHEAQRSFG